MCEDIKVAVDSSLWIEKYKPSTIDDVLIEEHLKTKFKEYIADEEIACLLFHGGPGNGKCVHYDTEIEVFVDDCLYEKIKLL